jgi:MoaA/NifB/PqqE/SkfB family radical SAM enzyme
MPDTRYPDTRFIDTPLLDPRKFRDCRLTADGESRAKVALTGLSTLWFNTGSLCNLSCHNCYMDSSPTNDRLTYIGAAEVTRYLDEIAAERMPVEEIGFTGGEPFMNPEFPEILEETLARGFRVLVLTNAMKPMRKCRAALLRLHRKHGERLKLRVSIDHHRSDLHEALRGNHSWRRMIEGLCWLTRNGVRIAIAGRTCWNEDEAAARDGYARLFAALGLPISAHDPETLVLFPEMDETADVPEITVACWDLLGVAPEAMMCATSRMVVKRRGSARPVVMPCTLLPYDRRFELGESLSEATGTVPLNHPHCARFCVLGGGSCSAR